MRQKVEVISPGRGGGIWKSREVGGTTKVQGAGGKYYPSLQGKEGSIG